MSARDECPNIPDWAMPGVRAVSPEGFCFHCSKVRGEWVECEASGSTLSHGDLPAPNMEQLLEPDPEVYLAGGPLAPDLCECEAMCTCDGAA